MSKNVEPHQCITLVRSTKIYERHTQIKTSTVQCIYQLLTAMLGPLTDAALCMLSSSIQSNCNESRSIVINCV